MGNNQIWVMAAQEKKMRRLDCEDRSWPSPGSSTIFILQRTVELELSLSHPAIGSCKRFHRSPGCFIAVCIIVCWYLQYFCGVPAERLGRAIHTTFECRGTLLFTFESWLRWCQMSKPNQRGEGWGKGQFPRSGSVFTQYPWI